jgi:hypothetical protein
MDPEGQMEGSDADKNGAANVATRLGFHPTTVSSTVMI